MQNGLNETLNLSDLSAQGTDQELDLDIQGFDLLMDTLTKNLFCGGSQK